jgi:hypothetical protein
MLHDLTADEVARLIRMEIAQDHRGEVSWPALEHQHGSNDECALVAVCTALGRDVAVESRRYEVENGKSLGEAARRASIESYRDTLEFLEGLWKSSCRLFFFSHPLSSERTYEMNPDLSGVGVMTCRDMNTMQRHAVAYENGWVYDGNAPSPLRYQVWALGVGSNVVVDGMSLRKETK